MSRATQHNVVLNHHNKKCISLLSLAITKYLMLGNEKRKEIYLADGFESSRARC
jgi:hypothetical protein